MEPLRLVRWSTPQGAVRVGFSREAGTAVPLDAAAGSLEEILGRCRAEGVSLADWARRWCERGKPEAVDPGRELMPVHLSELWAAGVTYEQSRDAREAETASARSIYARVYDAPRPELFLKAVGDRVAGPYDEVGLRPDATWHVPEPELTVILDDRGEIFGYTVGNDMTARDVEAANPLYLPQAKVFHHSAAIGPAVVLAGTVDPYRLTITLTVRRRGAVVFAESVSTERLRRRIDGLLDYLGRAWPLMPWTGLMTGTGIVPPDAFALEDGDEIAITIPEIGTLTNRARRIDANWVTVPAPMPRVLHIHPRDNVAVALGALSPGQTVLVDGIRITVRDAIPFGHKLAVSAIAAGADVVKYGERIGSATRPIEPGEYAHTHNVESRRGRGDLAKHEGGAEA